MLTDLASRLRTTRSEVLRRALEAFARGNGKSVTAVAGEIVGSWRGPKDLSENPRHLEGYGR
jgi:hypothetical protein